MTIAHRLIHLDLGREGVKPPDSRIGSERLFSMRSGLQNAWRDRQQGLVEPEFFFGTSYNCRSG